MTYHKGGDWSEENTVVVLTLSCQGYSASYIAKELGVTRNAVIGKLHRLAGKLPPEHELNRKAEAARNSAQARREKNEAQLARILTKLAEAKPIMKSPSSSFDGVKALRRAEYGNDAQPLPEAVAAPSEAKPVLIWDLDAGVCRFPLWKHDARLPTDEQFYCGASTSNGPYCPFHFGMSYQTLAMRDRSWKPGSRGFNFMEAAE